MRYYWKFLVHFLCSNSRHGTHSPFVYRLAEQLIYARRVGEKLSTINKADLLMEDIATFYNLKLTGEASHADNAGIWKGVISTVTIDELINYQEKFFMLFVTDIHSSSSNEKKWQQIIRHSDVIVTIDLFYFGIICKRQEQPKEHFRLRFPFWKY